jgi:peptidoglycan lytic transglycosylase G
MRRRYKQKKSSVLKILVLLIIIAGIVGIYKYQQYNYLIAILIDPENTEEVIFTIKKGENLKTIANNLEEKGLILDYDSFNWYGRLNGLDKQLKTGRFPVSASLNTPEIFEIIISNKTREELVTLPEGSTIVDIDNILTNLSLIQSGEFLQTTQSFENYSKYSFLNKETQSQLPHPLEGYLFPDTYFVSASNFSNDNFLSLLLNTFESKALPVISSSSRPSEQVIIVAAMIEKEANQSKDRPIISGIIWKRLDEQWLLGIDATLLYLEDDREIDYYDLQKDTPYNTRLNPGLPPGPIANPGLASIKAAAQPEESEYYFYLTSRDGEMKYAVNDSEHVRNKNQYL